VPVDYPSGFLVPEDVLAGKDTGLDTALILINQQ